MILELPTKKLICPSFRDVMMCAPLGSGVYMRPVMPAPTITSINIDFASCNGGESRIITGTNFFGAFTLTIDGVAATVTSSSSTSISFTVPASAYSTSVGNQQYSVITVTTAGGSYSTAGTPGNYLWYVPAYYGVTNCVLHSGQNVTTSSGNIATIPDMTGNGYTLTPISTAPAFTSAGTVSYWTTTAAAGALRNTSYPVLSATSTLEWVVGAMNTVNGPASTDHILCGLTGASLAFYLDKFQNTTVYQYSGNTTVNGVVTTLNTPFLVQSLFTGSTASQQILNFAAPTTGGNPGTTRVPTGGLVIGGISGSSIGWVGRIYFDALFPGGVTGGVAGRSSFSKYFTSQGIA